MEYSDAFPEIPEGAADQVGGVPEWKKVIQRLDKRLGDTEASVRNAALPEVEELIKTSRDLDELAYRMLWRGMFYGLWMADKLPVQLELANRLARTVHLIPHDRRQLYVKIFWRTVIEDWNRLDKYRMDKYYSLIRYWLNENLQVVQRTNWEAVPDFTSVLMELPLNTNRGPLITKDLLYHIADIYIDELLKVQPNFFFTLNHTVTLQLLEPFYQVMLVADEKVICRKCQVEVFDKLEALLGEQLQSVELSDEQKLVVEELIELIARRLFALGSAKETVDVNRSVLYEATESFRAVLKKAKGSRSKRKADQLDSTDPMDEDTAATHDAPVATQEPPKKRQKQDKQQMASLQSNGDAAESNASTAQRQPLLLAKKAEPKKASNTGKEEKKAQKPVVQEFAEMTDLPELPESAPRFLKFHRIGVSRTRPTAAKNKKPAGMFSPKPVKATQSAIPTTPTTPIQRLDTLKSSAPKADSKPASPITPSKRVSFDLGNNMVKEFQMTQKVVEVSEGDAMSVESPNSQEKKGILRVTTPTPVSNNVRLATIANTKHTKTRQASSSVWM